MRFWPTFVEKLPRSLLPWFARRISKTRALKVFPGWQFADSDDGEDLRSRLRNLLYTRVKNTGSEISVRIAWHDKTRIVTQLPSDMGLCAFVGGCFEPNEFALLDRVLRKDMVFIDGGANEGFYSIFAARRVGPRGRVIAIEPSARERERLLNNLRLNDLHNVEIVSRGLSDAAKRSELKIAAGDHTGQNTVGAFAYEGVGLSHNETIAVGPLDEIVDEQTLENVDVIKLDIEGSEFSALMGAKKVIEKFWPLILLELNDTALRAQGSSASAVADLLRAMGYRLYQFSEVSGFPEEVDSGIPQSSNAVAVHPSRPFSGVTEDVR